MRWHSVVAILNALVFYCTPGLSEKEAGAREYDMLWEADVFQLADVILFRG